MKNQSRGTRKGLALEGSGLMLDSGHNSHTVSPENTISMLEIHFILNSEPVLFHGANINVGYFLCKPEQ